MKLNLQSAFLWVSLVLFNGLAQPLWAKEYTIAVAPDSSAIPLLVLEAKQKQWLPQNIRIKVTEWPLNDACAQRVIVALKTADLGFLELQEGGYLYSVGFDHLRLAGLPDKLTNRSTHWDRKFGVDQKKPLQKGLWIIRDGQAADAILHSLKSATNFINKTSNHAQVAQIIAARFHGIFGAEFKPKDIELILAHKVLISGFGKPQNVIRQVKAHWASHGLFPDDDIFDTLSRITPTHSKNNREISPEAG